MSQDPPPKWTLPQCVGFRFIYSYLILFFFPFPAGLDDFPLLSRGFRWISEAPYFR
jgi:hypothetical protein